MKSRILGFSLFLLILYAGYSIVDAAEEDTLTAEQKELNLKSFEYVWKTIHEKHFDPEFGGLDWMAIREELRPKVISAKNQIVARAVIVDMISRLNMSHINIIPSSVYDNLSGTDTRGGRGGTTGFDIRIVDGKALVTTIEPDTYAADLSIKPGWEIIKVNDNIVEEVLKPIAEHFEGKTWQEYILTSVVKKLFRGDPGDTVYTEFEDGSGERVNKSIILSQIPGKEVKFGYLPAFYLTTKTDTLDSDIGYFYFNCFFDPMKLMKDYNAAMKSFLDARGIIIDIRGNPGGIGAIGVGMAGWLVAEKNKYIGKLITRDNTLKLVVNPRAQIYKGPVAILVDGLSGSSSEFFSGGLQDFGRVKIFGTPTMGAALPSMIEKLPNGDGFQYVFADYISASGERLESRGVLPDFEIRLDRKSLLKGEDPVLNAAVKWINEQ